ncbi:hypothetical protein IMSHALPRED_005996 [Imshaugia aleurites]|uniref:Uncharacterized protein n=1 Tax=Imshaugia aleurites TaxID=172621 RepID=A0A8H3FFT2_9LECA|nr:hypothetical protein IMSHALPRED_005996 [Imshaugia aleurites]
MANSPSHPITSLSATDTHLTATSPKPSKKVQVFDCHDDSNSERIDNLGRPQPASSSILPLGVPSQKKLLHITEILSVLASIVCLAAAIPVVSPSLGVAWKLGLKRQLQVIGFLLSIMNQCFRIVSPRLFLIMEATVGRSLLQNYDAILRNSALLSHTSSLWRMLLLFFIALPLGLSVGYKEFQQGLAAHELTNTGNYYGMTGPAGLEDSGQWTGLSLMVNATLPFMTGPINDSMAPDNTPMPIAFGFNGLLLSSTSAAFLDGPMPDYVFELQQSLNFGESYELSTTVHATLTTYNESVEAHRDDEQYWDYYNVSQMNDIWLWNDDYYLGILFNQTSAPTWNANQSWNFLGLFQYGGNGSIDTNFTRTALQFSTRRELCDARWKITFDSIKIVDGSCDHPPLPDESQNMYTQNSFAFDEFYLPTLLEFLQPFAFARNQSRWLVPTFTTMVAGMYWSRVTSLDGYQGWGSNKTVYNNSDPSSPQRADFYYPLNDTIVSFRPAMNPTWTLYGLLACQPILVILIVAACLIMNHAPVGNGFGMVAILAGARAESLRLLEGASFSGNLKRPLRMRILVHDTNSTGEIEPLRNEYVFNSQERNQLLSRHGQTPETPLGYARKRKTFSMNSPRHNQYEMI